MQYCKLLGYRRFKSLKSFLGVLVWLGGFNAPPFYLKAVRMNKKQCLNCRQYKIKSEFEKMRLGVGGRSLLCSACMLRLKDKPDFWVLYAQLQNVHSLTVIKTYDSLSPFYDSKAIHDRVIYPKCTPAMPYIKPLKYTPMPINKKRYYTPEKKKRQPRTPTIEGLDKFKIIQYNAQGFEVDAHKNVFEASIKTGFSAKELAIVLDTETLLNGFKFVFSSYGKRR